MSLAPGTRIGPYEVVSMIGAGGMGKVYRGRDPRLQRDIALKILPEVFASNPDRLARFEREAHAIAALDHPHICVIYDVGETNGTPFFVMPYLDGQTLAARLEKGALPLDHALKIAAETADALDKAHRQGIVHRDLKPANIMLTKTGAKLLDFGLAKLKEPAGPISLSRMEPLSTTTPGTALGTILGTLQYMAPEQVEGREADARSDIWGLGAVIYEMTTGTPPFAGDTPAMVIGSILKDTPPSISTRQPLAPEVLTYLIERCLAKAPDDRWQSIGDVGRMLEWISSNQAAEVERHPRPRDIRKGRTGWIAAAAMLLIALAFAAPWRRPVVATGDIVRLSVNPPERTVFSAHATATVPTPQFAVSPDGRSLVFVAAAPALRPMLWLQSLDDPEARVYPGTEDASEPFWSPDSRWIGFFDGQGRLRKVAVSGGTVQKITDMPSDFRGASWSGEDSILFGTAYGGIHQVPAAGGTPQAVTELDSSKREGSHRWPEFLPDGRHFLFTVRSGLPDHQGVYVGALDSKTRHLLIRADGNARYAASGHVLFLKEDTLLSQSFDHERLEVRGQPIPVASRIGRSSRGDGTFSASSMGTLAYAGASLRPGRLTWFDRSGNQVSVIGPDGEHDYADFRLSPDETRVAASLINPRVSVPDIWLIDLALGSQQQFTFGPAVNAAAVWSPDGGRIAFRTNRKGLTEIYQKSAGAGGNEQPLMPDAIIRAAGVAGTNLTPSDWSADGQYIAFAGGVPADLWLLPLAGNKKPFRLVPSPSDQMHANFSPDGRFIAYTSNESGRCEVFVETVPPSDLKRLVSINGGYEPRWRADGREIYYLSEDRQLMVVSVSASAKPLGVPRRLFPTDVYPGVSVLRTHYVPSRDGTRFLVHTRSRDFVPVPITIVLNWPAVLKR
jgi:Tol biopolymer transport system component